MATLSKIPIRNVYWLLCYAWDQLQEGELVDISNIDISELADLFALVLLSGSHHLLRRGLEQDYQLREESLAAIRGRINVTVTARKMLAHQGRAHCEFDELTVNTLANQIIKSTVRHLYRNPTLSDTIRQQMAGLYRKLGGIDDIPLTRFAFRKVQLHSNNRVYRFLLNVCEFVQASWMADEATGEYRFRDFLRDEAKMARLFERFVFNFYKNHRPDLAISREHISWDAKAVQEDALIHLPRMETDISVRSEHTTLIIDTKYYREAMQQRGETEKIKSANLYQIFAYLKNMEAREGSDSRSEGMLLYPQVNESLRLEYQIAGHRVRICTLDLAQEWPEIRAELLDLLDLT